MDRVFETGERPFDEIHGVAIAIAEVDEDQRHTGVLHRDEESGRILMLDLQWHHRQ